MVECVLFFRRAYRIGQRRDVKVYRLISLGTIEEMMYLRQVYKQVTFPYMAFVGGSSQFFSCRQAKSILGDTPLKYKKSKPSDNPGWRKGCEGTISCSRLQHNSSAPALITKVQRL